LGKNAPPLPWCSHGEIVTSAGSASDDPLLGEGFELGFDEIYRPSDGYLSLVFEMSILVPSIARKINCHLIVSFLGLSDVLFYSLPLLLLLLLVVTLLYYICSPHDDPGPNSSELPGHGNKEIKFWKIG
jgi:hypothetical protein